MKNIFIVSALMSFALMSTSAFSNWDPDEEQILDGQSKQAIKAMKAADSSLHTFFDSAAGYAVIPKVTKGGLGIGGARGSGAIYEGGVLTGLVTMTQLSIGFQAGGQVYSEIIFFKDETAIRNFERGNTEFGAEASAVAITEGASAQSNYDSGVAIFTQVQGGLMAAASVGGQKFKIEMKPE
jgi:lipid-binding SYLF domain-containing protein